MRIGRVWKIAFFGVGIVTLIALAILLSYLTINGYQTETQLQTGLSNANQVTLPTYQYYFLQNQSYGEPDISVAITLKYNGTLVAGEQHPVNLSAIAFTHSFEARNATSIRIGFQDALSYPRIPAQTFPPDGTANLTPSKNQDNQLGGWGLIYFPLEGSYHPTIDVIINECKTGVCVSYNYLSRIISVATLQVQPTSRLEDETIAIANLQLTLGLYAISLLGLFGLVIATFKAAAKYTGVQTPKAQIRNTTLSNHGVGPT